MAAKLTMILFPIGVFLALAYLIVSVVTALQHPVGMGIAPEVHTMNASPVAPLLPATTSPVISEATTTNNPATTAILSRSMPSVQTPAIAPKNTAGTSNVSAKPLNNGVIEKSWSRNSWGVATTYDSASSTLLVEYHKPWEALSLYSAGFAPNKLLSVEVSALGSPDELAELHLSFYKKTEKLGGVPLAQFPVAGKAGLFRVPLVLLMGTSTVVTDIAVESASAEKIMITNISFSALPGAAPLPLSPAIAIPLATTSVVETATTSAVKVTTSPNVFYYGGLENNWQLTAKRGVIIDTMSDEYRSVTGNAIEVHFSEKDGSLAFTNQGGVATKGYRALHMMIYPGTTDHEWQELYVTLYDAHGDKLGTRDVMLYSGNGRLLMQNWNTANIPLTELEATDTVVTMIDIENVNTTQDGDHTWFDDVRFVDDTGY